MVTTEYAAPSLLERLWRPAFLAALGGLLVLLVGSVLPAVVLGGHEQFWRSYFLGWVYWLGIGLGALGVLMIQHMSGGVWGATMRRLLEAAALTIPVSGLLFIPIALFGMHELYEWSHEGFMVGEILSQKAQYLNEPFFFARMAVYFALWTLAAVLLARWSRALDRTADHSYQSRMTTLSGPGLVLYAITMTTATVDLLLSLDAEFYSTIWGVLITGGFVLSAFALMIVVLSVLTTRGALRNVVGEAHFLDVGKLLLAFTILWTYFSFSQFLIVYSGNLPQEARWYTVRLSGGWEWVGLALLMFQFVLPFLLLLSRGLKESPRLLVRVAALVAAFQFLHLIWLSSPNWYREGFHISWMDLAAFVGFGGVFGLVFMTVLRSRPLLPLYVMPSHHPRATREARHAGR